MSPDQIPYHFYYSNCPSLYTFITHFLNICHQKMIQSRHNMMLRKPNIH